MLPKGMSKHRFINSIFHKAEDMGRGDDFEKHFIYSVLPKGDCQNEKATRTWGNSSWLPPLRNGVLPASAPDLGRGVAPLGPAKCAGRSLPH